MVARLTVGKKGYEVSEEVMQHAQTITLRLLDEFMALIDKDSAAYNEVFACFKLPKTTDEAKAARSTAIQKATKQAALVPLEVARKALDMMSIIADVARLGNRNAVTDALSLIHILFIYNHGHSDMIRGADDVNSIELIALI